MYLTDYRTILLEKYRRQQSIKQLKKHANGFCCHIGQISPGCRSCFTREGCIYSVFIGSKCLYNCPMCYYDILPSNANENIENEINNIKKLFFSLKQEELYKPVNITFNSHGEPFLYLDAYKQISNLIKDIEKEKEIIIHKRIYTSGTLINDKNLSIIKEIGIEEVRFHVSASNFSDKVFEGMRKTKDAGFRITVEEPAWLLNRRNLMKSLPIFEEIGVSHLNIDEIDITPTNILNIENTYPNGRMYKNLNYHLYDEGMVYDIMEEVIEKKYSFSVLDCNSDLYKNRVIRENNMIDFNFESIDKMCSKYNFGERNDNIKSK